MQTNHHVGRLVRPVKLEKVGDKQVSRAFFTLVVNRKKGTNVDFISYVALGKSAEILAKHGLKKGQILELNFEIHSSKYADENGEVKFSTTFLVTSFCFWTFESRELTQRETTIDASLSGEKVDEVSKISNEEVNDYSSQYHEPEEDQYFDDMPDYGDFYSSRGGEF